MKTEEAKRIIEAILFASDRPLPISQIKEILGDVDAELLRSLVYELKAEYEQIGRSFRIEELAGGFQICTEPAYAPWLKRLYKSRHRARISRPTLETLAIIAYRQPIARSDIEFIRGVDTSGILRALLERRLIRVVGRGKTPGRPIIYGTTNEFLEHFGLNSLAELPKMEEFVEGGGR